MLKSTAARRAGLCSSSSRITAWWQWFIAGLDCTLWRATTLQQNTTATNSWAEALCGCQWTTASLPSRLCTESSSTQGPQLRALYWLVYAEYWSLPGLHWVPAVPSGSLLQAVSSGVQEKLHWAVGRDTGQAPNRQDAAFFSLHIFFKCIRQRCTFGPERGSSCRTQGQISAAASVRSGGARQGQVWAAAPQRPAATHKAGA